MIQKETEMIRLKLEYIKKIIHKRLFWAQIVFFFMFALVFFSLFNIQIVNPPEGKRIGQYEKVEIPVPRGTIYDRNGKVMAISVPYYSLYIDSWKVNHQKKKDPSYPEKLKKELVSILKIGPGEIEKKLQQRYPLMKKELSVEEYKAISEKKLPGTVFLPSYKRIYPGGKVACHILGFAGIDGYGLEGAELYYDNILKGEKGISLILKDGTGDLIYSVEKKLSIPKPGKDIYLTIDSNLQYIVEEEIESVYYKYNAAGVSAIVIDYDTGEVLALANKPNYDPNHPDKFSPSDRRNRAVTDLFEPGSTFKIVTAAAAIEEGVVSPDDVIDCESGKWFVRNHYLRDVHPYGRLKVREVIEKSSNIGTVKIAMKLGEAKLYEYCKKFGFGELTGIDLPGEIKGILRPLNRWSGYSITAVPIGQEVGINALQSIKAMAVIANGGYHIQPHILKEFRDTTSGAAISWQGNEKQRVLSQETCETLREILQEVTGPRGTAPLANIPGYSISGKTGTAQKIIDGHYSKDRFVASFVGFLNHKDAKMLILVKVDEPRPVYYGGLVAAPVFKNIMWRSLQHLDVPPATSDEEHRLAMTK
ncbi:MAG: penicillin-binding protein 2 [Candidatus Ratteibacteria bacterium]|nr:penicillin-binding protein 2 [Candidatus Ratteibacteria bacterium]